MPVQTEIRQGWFRRWETGSKDGLNHHCTECGASSKFPARAEFWRSLTILLQVVEENPDGLAEAIWATMQGSWRSKTGIMYKL